MRERSRRRGKGVGGESKQITPNGVSDWLEWGMLGGEGCDAAPSMPVGDALRTCFPPLLFISLIYLYAPLQAQPLAARAGPWLFLFISSLTSRGFPVGVL